MSRDERDRDAPRGPRGPRRTKKSSGPPRSGQRGGDRQRGAPIVRRGTVRLGSDVARRVRSGHPWVYREAISRPLNARPGDAVELIDWDGEFLARGIFDGDSPISVRVVTRNPDRAIDDALVAERVRSAVALRRRTLDLETYECARMINAESDGLPAISVDRYGEYLVAQLFTPAVLGFCDALYATLEAELAPRGIYEQRRFRSLAGDAPRGSELVRGQAAPVELVVAEGPMRFGVDVTAPLSAGLFPDLREGRLAIAQWASERRVLNLFSYTGAISVAAVHGGAASVTAVDVSAKAHARSRKNLAHSGFDPEGVEHLTGDAFKVMADLDGRGRRFEMVILDPPAFGSASRGGRPWSASQDYRDLVAAALEVLEPSGLLCAVSSMRRLGHADFDTALGDGAALAGAHLRIIARRSLPPDFPSAPGFPESNYLKFAIAVRD